MRIHGSTSTLTVLGVHVLSDLLSAHLTLSEILWVNIKMDFSSTSQTFPRRHKAGSDFSSYENKANDSWSGNLIKIQRSAHLSVERSDYRIEMEMKPKKEEQGITESQGGVKSAPGKRDGLKQLRQRSRPAQQELLLLIYINPADISIFPALSQMQHLNFCRSLSQFSSHRTRDTQCLKKASEND